MIKEAFVSFEVAKLLKEKGFVESCYGRYSVRSKDFHLDTTKPCNNGSNFLYCAPTHQMAMAWLREVHNIFIVIEPYSNTSCYFSLWEGDNYYENPLRKGFPSYEETVEQALKYCLEKIIK